MTDSYKNTLLNNWIKIAKFCRENYAGKLDEYFYFTWGFHNDDPSCVGYGMCIHPTGEICAEIGLAPRWNFPKRSTADGRLDEDGFIFVGGTADKRESRDYGINKEKIRYDFDSLELFITKWPQTKAKIEKEIQRQASMRAFQP